MCGRYQFSTEVDSELQWITGEIAKTQQANAWTPGEIRPSCFIPVLTAIDGQIQPMLQKWGYPLNQKLVINARAESAAETPLFRDSVQHYRCVIPASGFYEWNEYREKFLYTLPGESVLHMAGIYILREGIPCCCILTTRANASVMQVHPRMPLVLQRQQVSVWLEQPNQTAAILNTIPPLLKETALDSQQLRLW